MHPRVEKTAFGMIQIDGQKYKSDVVIELDGKIRKRRKKLSKARYGTSHIVSLEEAQDVYQHGMNTLLIGSGVFDSVRLSEEAQRFFQDQDIEIKIHATPAAAKIWNASSGAIVGVFHITC